MFPHFAPRRHIPLLLAGLALLLSACSAATGSFVRLEQPQQTDFIQLQSGESIGQTFTVRYRGLEGVGLYLKPDTRGEGVLRLALFPAPAAETETSPITSASLDLNTIDEPGYYRFRFEPQTGPTPYDYYLEITLEGQGSVMVGRAPGNVYLNGAAYAQGEAQGAQLTFRLLYDRPQAGLGLLHDAALWLRHLLMAAALFVLPGWALLIASGWDNPTWHWTERLSAAGALSLALVPLLFLTTGLVGLRLGALYAWLPPLVAVLYLIWRAYQGKSWRTWPRPRWQLDSRRIGEIVLLLGVGLVLVVRLWPLRTVDVPMWGDAYQHSLIVQLLVENGGLFQSWQPYAEMVSFTYHFGFHSLSAVFHWMSGMPASQAVLWTGQILNILAVLFCAGLAVRVSAWHPAGSKVNSPLAARNAIAAPWVAAVAIVVAGLLAPMPMFYTNWGRYTQLAGQSILPGAIWLAWVLLGDEQPEHECKWAWLRRLVPLWIAYAGLAITHYRVLMLAAVFFPALYLLVLRSNSRQQNINLVRHSLGLGIGAGLLFLPWFVRTAGGELLRLLGAQVSTPAAQVSDYALQSNAIGNLFTYLPAGIWILLPLIIGWGLWRRQSGAAVMSLWWLGIVLLANPNWLNLPGIGTISNFAAFVAFYIPAALLCGAAAGWLVHDLNAWLCEKRPMAAIHNSSPAASALRRGTSPQSLAILVSLTAGVLLLGVGARAARPRLGEIQPPVYAMVTRPDLRAMEWIRTHTPSEARFLINSFFAYGGTGVVGADGGWWLPLLANRQTTIPPLTYGLERGPFPGYPQWVNQVSAQIETYGISHPDTLALLKERRVTHIYIGQRQGQVGRPPDAPPALDPQELVHQPFFKLVYHEDQVWIFEITFSR